MGREELSKKIGDTNYSVKQMDVHKSLRTQLELGRIVADALPGAIPAALSESMESIGDLLGSMVQALRNHGTPDDNAKFIEGLLDKELVSADGKPLNMDIQFAGPAGGLELYEVAYFVLEVNFTGFLAGFDLGALAERFRSMTKSGSEDSPPTST